MQVVAVQSISTIMLNCWGKLQHQDVFLPSDGELLLDIAYTKVQFVRTIPAHNKNSPILEKTEVDFLINKYSNIAKEYTERFIEHIIYNQDKFPEYNLNSNGDTYPNDISNYGGWILILLSIFNLYI